MSLKQPVVIPLKLKEGLVDRFESLAHLKGSFLLDSVTTDYKEGRYSFAGINPIHTFSSTGGFVTIDGHTVIDNPLRAIKKLITLTRGINVEDNYLPFMGGLVGFIGFEWGNSFGLASPNSDVPDLLFGLYDTIATFDHLENCAWISSFGLREDGATDVSLAKERVERLASKLIQGGEGGFKCFYPPLYGSHSIISSLTKDSFINGVGVLKKEDHLPVFARQFKSPTHKDPWRVYLDIRGENRAAYAAYLNCGDFYVLSASRTRLIKIENEIISVKPTKGYAPRSKNADEETKQINNLKYNPEIQESHRYIVSDVMRNLSHMCKEGTIEAEDIAHIESDAKAHHLVSKVSGQKLKGSATIDCVLNVMQAFTDFKTAPLLGRLEKTPRNVYTGTIGFIGVNGASEFNFAFRTMILKDTIGYLHAGSEIGKETDAEETYINTQKAAEHIFQLVR